MFEALERTIDVATENARSHVRGHILLYNPSNTPTHWLGKSSNRGAKAALDHVLTRMQPPHILSPTDALSVHKLTPEAWVVECHATWPSSLYTRLSYSCAREQAIGDYSLQLRLIPSDLELKIGTFVLLVLYLYYLLLYMSLLQLFWHCFGSS